MSQEPNTQQISCLLTLPQFVEKHKAFRLGGMRALIFNEETNGLSVSGAIVRIGRKILIHEQHFFNWIDSQNQTKKRA